MRVHKQYVSNICVHNVDCICVHIPQNFMYVHSVNYIGDSKMPGYDISYVHILLPLTWFYIYTLFSTSRISMFPYSSRSLPMHDDFSSISSVYVTSAANREISCNFCLPKKKNFLKWKFSTSRCTHTGCWVLLKWFYAACLPRLQLHDIFLCLKKSTVTLIRHDFLSRISIHFLLESWVWHIHTRHA